MNRIGTGLWFDDNAEEAVNFYLSIFKNAKIESVVRYTEEGNEIHRRPAGSVMTIDFTLDGSYFQAINGGPIVKFNEAVSLIVNCDTQEEIDHYWDALSAGGNPNAQQCGWLKDKFGVSWQVVPTFFARWAAEPVRDKERDARIMRATLQMKKLDISALERAYHGE